MKSRGYAAAIVAALLATAKIAAAQDPPAAIAEGAADAEKLASAKNFFRDGVALLNTGDYEGALAYFLRSRALVPSSQNTTNVAICLDNLGRYDEALDMYEELLLKFDRQISADVKANLTPVMAALRIKVGALSVFANVEGRVVVDGRARGMLPASSVLRVLGGKHTVRIFRDGYTAFEVKVDVPVGTIVVVDGRLNPLAEAGLLRVENPASDGFDVVVDGASVGRVPWEGTLPPGRHLVWTRRGDVGSAPREVEILLGQTALARLDVTDLGPPIRLSVTPATAQIKLDGVPLGRHTWEGRVPVGQHEVTLAEEGYFTQRTSLSVSQSSVYPERLTATLQMNPEHARWPRPVAGHFFLSMFGGYGGGRSLGSDPGDPFASAVPRTVQGGASNTAPGDSPRGNILGLRGGYRFRTGFAAELSGGYLSFSATPETVSLAEYLGYPIEYKLDHWIRARGNFFGLGGSYRAAIRPWIGVFSRITVGLATLTVNDDLTGIASDESDRKLSIFVAPDRRQTVVSGVGEATAGAVEPSIMDRRLFVFPELGLDITWKGFFAGLALGIEFFPGIGPNYQSREIGVTPLCSDKRSLGSVGCAPNVLVPAERVYGNFLLWTPQLSVGYVF